MKSFPQLVTDNHVFVWFSNIPSRYRWAITGLIGLLIILVWSFLFLMPLFSKIKDKSLQIKEQKKLLAVLKKGVENERSIEDESVKIKNSINSMILEGKENITKTILSIAKQSNNSCSFITPIKKKNRDVDLYGAGECLNVGIKGSFSNILIFLDLLTQKNKCVKIAKLSCIRIGDGKVSLILCLEMLKEV